MEFSHFFTPLNELNFNSKIQLNQNILAIGSCFSTNIGSKLKAFDFNIKTNPFGTVFNPISILNHLRWAIENKEPEEALFLEYNGLWFHYHWHSSFCATTITELKSKIKSVQQEIAEYLLKTDVLILTLGTAIVRKKDSITVNNCHKQPSTNFTKDFLTVEEIMHSFSETIKAIRAINPQLRIITTTSPIRHTKEGLISNNTSKSILNLFNHKIQEENDRINYFPSFEIMNDVLRDYRFFKSDLIHPNDQALEFIWDIFQKSVIHETCFEYIRKKQRLIKMENHRVNHEASPSSIQFFEKKQKLESELEQLKQKINA